MSASIRPRPLSVSPRSVADRTRCRAALLALGAAAMAIVPSSAWAADPAPAGARNRPAASVSTTVPPAVQANEAPPPRGVSRTTSTLELSQPPIVIPPPPGPSTVVVPANGYTGTQAPAQRGVHGTSRVQAPPPNGVTVSRPNAVLGWGGLPPVNDGGPHGHVQPGHVQPGYVQPGYVQPGYVQPGYVQPGYVQPGYVQPPPPYPGAGQVSPYGVPYQPPVVVPGAPVYTVPPGTVYRYGR